MFLEPEEVKPPSGAPYQLDGDKMVLRGRWRSYWRTAVVVVALFVLQQPLRQVADGSWASVQPLSRSVPARLSLLVDLGMIIAYSLMALRGWELVRWWWPAAKPYRQPMRVLAALGLGLVVIGAILDVVEDYRLWLQTGPEDAKDKADLTLEPLSYVMLGFVAVGLALGAVLAFSAYLRMRTEKGAASRAQRAWPATAGKPPAAGQLDQPGLIVCCSGGGIRAASFCLGGLQALGPRYQDVDSVVGVSGGGYIAAAHHVLRWRSTDEHDNPWARLDPRAYSPGSPEERWLRRHSRYLLDSGKVGALALLSAAFGLVVNLLFITAILGATAWLTAWFLLASGGVRDWTTKDAVANQYEGVWSWAGRIWVIPAVGLGLFVCAKVADRMFSGFKNEGRDRTRDLIVLIVIAGTVAAAAVLLFPALLVWLHDFAYANQPKDGGPANTLTEAFANLLTSLGFATPVNPPSEGGAQQAGGTAISGVSLAAIAATVLTTVRLLSASFAGSDGKVSKVGKLWTALWGKVKNVVLPWVAAVVVVTLLVVVFLSWTVSLLSKPEQLSRWELAFIYGALVGAAFILTDANHTSLHHYYRERLSSAFLVQRTKTGVPKELKYSKPLSFSAANPGDDPATRHGPKLITCAVANVSDPDVVPTKRACTPFVFSHDKIGLTEDTLPDSAQVTSDIYEFAADSRYRDATIPAAMAISGAAFSPLAGRENVQLRPYRLVLALANARLGVWLPNPLWVNETEQRNRKEKCTGARQLWDTVKDIVGKPNPFLVFREAFGATSVHDRFLYVTDGGHYDNLGLVEALRRQPRRLLVLDASNDPEDSFNALGRAIATARMDLGCDIDIDLTPMSKGTKTRPSSAWRHGTISYRTPTGAEERTGELWVAKAIMVNGMPWDVEVYQLDHKDFPRTSTGNQLYGEFDVEAYRSLGYSIVKDIPALTEEIDEDPWPEVEQAQHQRRARARGAVRG